jgi:hypothetical protein
MKLWFGLFPRFEYAAVLATLPKGLSIATISRCEVLSNDSFDESVLQPLVQIICADPGCNRS